MAVGQTNPRGEALARELKWVHDALRQDLGIVTRLAQGITDGMPAIEVRDELGALRQTSPIWAFRIHCMHFCRLVEMHHKMESAHLFPAVRDSDPAMVAVADRLDAEHATIAEQLGQVETAVEELLTTDDPDRRDRAASLLNSLGEQLLAHLEYEEEQLVPLLGTWTGWPYRTAW